MKLGPLTLFFSIVLASLDVLPLHINFKISLLILCWDFYWDCIEFIHQVGKNFSHLDSIDSYYLWTWNIFVYLVLWYFPSEFCGFSHIAPTCILLDLCLSISFWGVLICMIIYFKLHLFIISTYEIFLYFSLYPVALLVCWWYGLH